MNDRLSQLSPSTLHTIGSTLGPGHTVVTVAVDTGLLAIVLGHQHTITLLKVSLSFRSYPFYRVSLKKVCGNLDPVDNAA